MTCFFHFLEETFKIEFLISYLHPQWFDWQGGHHQPVEQGPCRWCMSPRFLLSLKQKTIQFTISFNNHRIKHNNNINF